jgi:nucleotide-binding universal stress UspA family protein
LVPVSGGPNSRLAAKLAVDMALSGEEGPAQVTLMHIIPAGAQNGAIVRAQQAIEASMVGLSYNKIEKRIVEGTDIVNTILAEAESSQDGHAHDLIVIGATLEPLFRRLRFGSIPEQVALRANVSVVMVKRRSSPLHSFLRQTVFEPTSANQGSTAKS